MDTFGLDLRGGVRPPNQLDYHLKAFACRQTVERGGLGPLAHFKYIVNALWGTDNEKFTFVWHDQLDEMAEAFCTQEFVEVAGHASSSKSGLAAAYCNVSVIADPMGVKCLIGTTTKAGADGRILGSIKRMISALPANTLRYTKAGIVEACIQNFPPDRGMELVASNKEKERAAADRIRGQKAPRMIVVADEGTGVADGFYDTYFSNIQPSNENAQLIVLFNFDNISSRAGQMAEPVDEEGNKSWGNVSVDVSMWDIEWQGIRGVCIHLDALQSENWLHHLAHPHSDENVHPFALKWQSIQAKIDAGETDTVAWWRDIRSFPAPMGIGQGGFVSLSELTSHRAFEHVDPTDWQTPPTLFHGLDPAWKAGGDNVVLTDVTAGTLRTGDFVINLASQNYVPLDANNKVRDPVYQIADYCGSRCNQAGNNRANLGFDSTNDAFSQVFNAEFGRAAYAVPFGGAASENRHGRRGPNDTPPPMANEIYANRVSELHGVFVAFLRAGRIRGLDPKSKLVKQMTSRRWKDRVYAGGKARELIEPKPEYKGRTGGESPDELDSYLVALQTVIARLRVTADSKPTSEADRAHKRWLKNRQMKEGVRSIGAHKATSRRSLNYSQFRQR